MGFKNLLVIVLRMKVVFALEGFKMVFPCAGEGTPGTCKRVSFEEEKEIFLNYYRWCVI